MTAPVATLRAGSIEFGLRRAALSDVPRIVQLLAADALGAAREDAGGRALPAYQRAFEAIDADSSQLLLVATFDGEVVGTMQITFIPGLARKGTLRAQVEAVRVASDQRGAGLGAAMLEWAVEEARRRGCGLVQLTSDKTRVDAHRFYERLGFEPSHVGFKLRLGEEL